MWDLQRLPAKWPSQRSATAADIPLHDRPVLLHGHVLSRLAKMQASNSIPRLACTFRETYVAGSEFPMFLNLSFAMQSYVRKNRLPEDRCHADDHHASDGYYVFVSLICAVASITTAIVLMFSIEMLI